MSVSFEPLRGCEFFERHGYERQVEVLHRCPPSPVKRGEIKAVVGSRTGSHGRSAVRPSIAYPGSKCATSALRNAASAELALGLPAR